MRVAVLHNLPTGGGLRSLVAVLRGLSVAHHVELFLPAGAERRLFDPEEHAAAVNVYPYRQHWPQPPGLWAAPLRVAITYAKLATLMPVWRRIARDVDRGGFDVALVNPCAAFYTPPAVLWMKTPSVFLMQEVFRWVYEPEPRRGYRPWPRRVASRALFGHLRFVLGRIDRAAARRVSCVVANSNFEGDLIARTYGVETVVEYPEVDAERFRPDGGPRGGHVLSVGGIEPLKGYDFLVRAIAAIPAPQRPPVELIGDRVDEVERTHLERLARDLGVTLRLRIRIGEVEMLEAYRRASVFVYAPVREPLGYGAIEAQASGLPVVAVGEGGIRETVLDGVTGLLVERDETSFARAVERVLEEPLLAARLGEAGRAHVLERWAGTGFAARIERRLEEGAALARH